MKKKTVYAALMVLSLFLTAPIAMVSAETSSTAAATTVLQDETPEIKQMRMLITLLLELLNSLKLQKDNSGHGNMNDLLDTHDDDEDDDEDHHELEIEVEFEDGEAKVKVRYEDGTKKNFTFDTTDEDEVVDLIVEETDLSQAEVEDVIEFEDGEDDEDDEDEDEDEDEEEDDDEDEDEEEDD